MRRLPVAAPPIVTVGRLARYVQRIVRENKWLRDVGVRGEISNLSRSNGNLYFRLKDDDAVLECVVWSEAAPALPPLENGAAVIAYGYVTTYERRSVYQLVARSVVLEGVGDLHAEYERLKKKLQAEGAFAAERKRPLPKYPYRIALVSSRDARGAGDFSTIVARRAPHVEIVLIPTPVQGAGAAIEIADAIDRASRLDVDLIVVARGGGSFEDLFAFSTEAVVRAILRARRPVVSAIGHEGDAPLSDFVADLRAPTPSDAANSIVPDRDELLRRIRDRIRALERCAERALQRAARDAERAIRYSALAQPSRFLGPRRQRVDRATDALAQRADAGVYRRRARLEGLARRLARFDPTTQLAEREKRLELAAYKLERLGPAAQRRGLDRLARVAAALEPALEHGNARRINTVHLLRAKLFGNDPEAILQRGYAIVRYDGGVVRDPRGVPVGGTIAAQVARGTLLARVEAREGDDPE